MPGKNTRLLAGKPLIAYAIEVGLACPSVDRVIVSTDGEEIADLARHYGADVPFIRPSHLASDESPELLSWKHALKYLRENHEPLFPDAFVSLPVTAPLRQIGDVERCIETFKARDNIDVVVTVKRVEPSPYFTMVSLDKANRVRRFIDDGPRAYRRQDCPIVHEIVPLVYVARPQFILDLDEPDYLSGRVVGVEVPRDRSIDIDTELDFSLAEFFMGRAGGSAD